MQRDVALWIDHRQTVIAAVAGETENLTRIPSGLEKHTRFSAAEGGAEDARDRRFEGHLDLYYDKVIAAIRDARSILILGPGEAGHEVEKRLRDAGLGKSRRRRRNGRQDDGPSNRGGRPATIPGVDGARGDEDGLAQTSIPGGPHGAHRTGRIGWLRAAVLGANDGIVSTASLVLGVAAAHASHGNVLVAGVAGLVAGAMSMAAGEYVSVHSQADTEQADLERERAELKADDKGEQQGTGGDLRRARARSVAREAGRRAAHGPRRARRARPRRARHLRDLPRAARFRRRWRRLPDSRSGRPCRCWSPSWPRRAA